MTRHNQSSQASFWGFPIDLILVIVSILAVAIATLYPFNFSIPENFSPSTLLNRFDNTSFFQDQVNNVLLFMPFGFGLTSILLRTRIPGLIPILIVVVASANLSFSVEFLQSFLPSRDPTVADIINNTIGGFVGLLCFYIWDLRSFNSTIDYLENSQASNSLKKVTVFFAGYILLTFLIGISWENNVSLSEWNTNFPLLIGNEPTGDRPWEGTVSQVSFADKEIYNREVQEVFINPNYLKDGSNSLLAIYQFSGKYNYRDSTGQLPELLWQGQLKTQAIDNQKGVKLTQSRWLQSAKPVTLINQRISKTSQFTVTATFATANLDQKGPARIISLSGDSLHRNLTLGQDNKDLALRLRTPITGQNGADIKLSVPNVFADSNSHRIIVTYAKAKLKVYVDKPENIYSFNLLELLPNNQKLFSYAVTFIPLGFCLALLTIIAKRQYNFNRLMLPCGILLPSLILEAFLIHVSGKSFSLINLGLGIFFTAFISLLFKARTLMLLKQM
jgi:VanZ family protein